VINESYRNFKPADSSLLFTRTNIAVDATKIKNEIKLKVLLKNTKLSRNRYQQEHFDTDTNQPLLKLPSLGNHRNKPSAISKFETWDDARSVYGRVDSVNSNGRMLPG